MNFYIEFCKITCDVRTFLCRVRCDGVKGGRMYNLTLHDVVELVVCHYDDGKRWERYIIDSTQID